MLILSQADISNSSSSMSWTRAFVERWSSGRSKGNDEPLIDFTVYMAMSSQIGAGSTSHGVMAITHLNIRLSSYRMSNLCIVDSCETKNEVSSLTS